MEEAILSPLTEHMQLSFSGVTLETMGVKKELLLLAAELSMYAWEGPSAGEHLGLVEGAIGQHWAAAAIGETLVSLEFTVSQGLLMVVLQVYSPM